MKLSRIFASIFLITSHLASPEKPFFMSTTPFPQLLTTNRTMQSYYKKVMSYSIWFYEYWNLTPMCKKEIFNGYRGCIFNVECNIEDLVNALMVRNVLQLFSPLEDHCAVTRLLILFVCMSVSITRQTRRYDTSGEMFSLLPLYCQNTH